MVSNESGLLFVCVGGYAQDVKKRINLRNLCVVLKVKYKPDTLYTLRTSFRALEEKENPAVCIVCGNKRQRRQMTNIPQRRGKKSRRNIQF